MPRLELEQPSHEIILVRTPHERQQCYDVRIEVFHHEQKFPLETEIDEPGDKATHFLLRLTPSLTPIGTIRASRSDYAGTTTKRQSYYYKLSRLAVLKEYRRYQFGRALVQRLHDWVAQDAIAPRATQQQQGDDDDERQSNFAAPVPPASHVVEIISHSQIPVKGFYAKFGYEPEGPEFDEDGDPHQKMVFRMPVGISVDKNTVAGN
ncbi:hypothetical protein M413DRAFT_64994 [Hebeloma cylindrosporum]|uniref:N-acetyltransferase domain-containing protein n=1 Tax=Hebeloma cylindrosporum TaxID=76867 RepID=A0A0C3CR84_HEBCY|nr:hypothetical protein M413DRAFT_64994 [Hebeloma cylindrosporum h7]